jgi:hypothetical protein
MIDIKATLALQHRYHLPHHHSIIRIQNASPDDQKKLVSEIFDLIKENYPDWFSLEHEKNWLVALTTGNQNGTKMAVSAVLNESGNVVGASAMELYPNGTAIINYSIGRKRQAQYLDIIFSATKDMLSGVAELQRRGETINFITKEHHLESDRARAGYYAVGQVPIDGPTSLIHGEVKYFEVAYGNPEHIDNLENLQQALMLADPKTNYTNNHDDNVHLWLIEDFIPSNPKIPLTRLLKEFAECYAKEHSIYRLKDFKLDPAYISLHEIANKIPESITYQHAVKASAIGAAKYLNLLPQR